MPDINDVFIGRAAVMNSELIFTEDVYECILKDFDTNSDCRNYSLKGKTISDELIGETPLGGNYQSKNILLLHVQLIF